MCHLVFFVPLVGLPLFWMFPLEYSLPINVLLWIAGGVLGYKVIKAMTAPAADGFKSLIGAEGIVVSAEGPAYLVKAGGELWTARSAGTLRPGDRVKVAATEGIKLVVKPS